MSARELVAAMAMQGLLSDARNLDWLDKTAGTQATYDTAAREVLHYVDALIAALAKENP